MAAQRHEKPSKFNPLSIFLLGGLLAAGYLGYCGWPVISLQAEVKSTMEDVLMPYYRANLRPEPQATALSAEVRKDLSARLVKLGLQPDTTEIIMNRDAKTVSIEVHYPSVMTLVGLDYRKTFKMAPKLETSAERVDW